MNITQYAESKQIDNFIIFMIPNILEPQLQTQKTTQNQLTTQNGRNTQFHHQT